MCLSHTGPNSAKCWLPQQPALIFRWDRDVTSRTRIKIRAAHKKYYIYVLT